jgi:hypothetical protein
MEAHQLTLSGLHATPDRGSITALVNPVNNLPTTTAYKYSAISAVPAALNAIIATVSTENTNLSEAQKELVCWHN